MKHYLFIAAIVWLAGGCTTQKQTTTSQLPAIQRIPAKFDYSPPHRALAASSGISIAIVKPKYVGKNPEYFMPPFNEMANSMGNDFEELLTAKGFTVRGPFGSRDEMVYNDKVNSGFVLEIGIDVLPEYRTKYYPTTKTNWAALFDKYAPPSITTYKTSGEIVLKGTLVINARSPQYGELIWKKNIDLESSSFTYSGSMDWNNQPTIADQLKHDNQVYNQLSSELEKFYLKTLNLAWQQIDAAEMRIVSEQSKKADKKSS